MIYVLDNIFGLTIAILVFLIIVMFSVWGVIASLGRLHDVLEDILTRLKEPTNPPYVPQPPEPPPATGPSTARLLGRKFGRSGTKSPKQEPTVPAEAILDAVVEADVDAIKTAPPIYCPKCEQPSDADAERCQACGWPLT